jgi:hypothetical protein
MIAEGISFAVANTARRASTAGEKYDKVRDRSLLRLYLPAGSTGLCCDQIQALCSLPGGPGERENLRVPCGRCGSLSILSCRTLLPHVRRSVQAIAGQELSRLFRCLRPRCSEPCGSRYKRRKALRWRGAMRISRGAISSVRHSGGIK